MNPVEVQLETLCRDTWSYVDTPHTCALPRCSTLDTDTRRLPTRERRHDDLFRDTTCDYPWITVSGDDGDGI